MEQRHIELELLAPAFLGDAEQRAAWRTPPIKAELRRWWRLAMAVQGARLADIRQMEGQFFGTAAGDSGQRSRVRLRLAEWRKGDNNRWLQPDSAHVRKGAHKAKEFEYLAYGRAGTKGANDSALPAGEKARLGVAWPAHAPGADALPDALGLLDRLGALGGRSNNGWGSCALIDAPGIELDRFTRDWQDALDEPWVHAIGRDERGPLLWQTTASHASWDGVMHDLAEVRKGLCKESGPLRPLMSWPVTGREGDVPLDVGGDRIPNTLRLRVVRSGPGVLRGLLFHLPCRPADHIWTGKLRKEQRRTFPDLWRKAHAHLDAHNGLQRVNQ